MIKKITILTSLFLCSACFGGDELCRMINRDTPTKCGVQRNIFGTQYYKYRCEKPGQCCEIGVDCVDEKNELRKSSGDKKSQ